MVQESGEYQLRFVLYFQGLRNIPGGAGFLPSTVWLNETKPMQTYPPKIIQCKNTPTRQNLGPLQQQKIVKHK